MKYDEPARTNSFRVARDVARNELEAELSSKSADCSRQMAAGIPEDCTENLRRTSEAISGFSPARISARKIVALSVMGRNIEGEFCGS